MSAPRAAVIGSGFGGLSTAIRLQAGGIDTTIFEGRDKPGGRAYVYEDDGFVFDAGPTVITAPQCLEELFEAADRQLADYVVSNAALFLQRDLDSVLQRGRDRPAGEFATMMLLISSLSRRIWPSASSGARPVWFANSARWRLVTAKSSTLTSVTGSAGSLPSAWASSGSARHMEHSRRRSEQFGFMGCASGDGIRQAGLF